MREHSIKVRRSARYYTLGPDDERTVRDVWFVLHGYGQLAAQFIGIFEAVNDGTRLIVAPEALNRFYVAGVETAPAAERGVGATWMTREDRLNEIDDYVAYLDEVSSAVLDRFRGQGNVPRVVLLGFSQGTATAARWVGQGALRPAHLVLWGGFLPPDAELSARGHPLRKPALHVLIGTRDRFASEERPGRRRSPQPHEPSPGRWPPDRADFRAGRPTTGPQLGRPGPARPLARLAT